VQIVCLALFEEKLNKFLDYLIISRISGRISGYPALPDIRPDIRPDTGYQKRPDYPAGYPVHP
jgi:hypothetical protein